jgi:membrane-bound metal-dependent hydrolase YbcI (DUF457 family)
LGGIAVAWGLAPRQTRAAAMVVAAIAIAPDVDLLIGEHRGISHSIGAACAAGLIAWAITKQPQWGTAAAFAWLSHIFFDWLSNDTRPPIGVMALWPFTDAYYKAAIEIFPPVSRRYWESRFWIYNLRALVAEVIVLGPPAALTLVLGRRRRT